jgi:hypothetical protein
MHRSAAHGLFMDTCCNEGHVRLGRPDAWEIADMQYRACPGRSRGLERFESRIVDGPGHRCFLGGRTIPILARIYQCKARAPQLIRSS